MDTPRSRRRHAVDRGYLSPYFITDPERMECVLEDVRILIHEKKISSIRTAAPAEQTRKASRS